MEVDVVINGQLTENASVTDEHQRHQKVDRRPLSKNKTYHVFFCYRDIPNDKQWVKEAVNKLENEFGFICCDHERDFLAGTKVFSNIKFGIKNSEKVVCVLSKEGLDSEYLRLETEMAHKEGIDKRENLLIPVVLDDCEIPDELKLLTYIDARKEFSERTWWPKLIAAIEAKAECSFFKGRKEEEEETTEHQQTYYFQKLCSLETTFNFKQCSVQSTSKYIPKELTSMDPVIPLETIKHIKRDLLDAPRIKRHQKCSWFCTGLVILGAIISIIIFILDILLIAGCAPSTTISKEECISSFVIWALIALLIGIGCGLGYICYCKIPKKIVKQITEYNSELFKNGLLITLVHTSQWRNVSIVFYRVSFDSCKQYILMHLGEERKTTMERLVNICETEAQHDADDVPLLTGSGNEDLTQAIQTLNYSHDMKLETETLVDSLEMQENHFAEDDPLLDVSENNPLDEPTEVYSQNVGLRQKNDDQESTIVNLSDQENRPLQFTPNSQIPQTSDLGDIENVAVTLLIKYALEYLRLVLNGKITNPKEDRHIADCMCICQYIEKTDKKFQKLVHKNKIIHGKQSSLDLSTHTTLDGFPL
ncbi:hypothetical protein ACJMK2_020888 [Sinanodonta woodiana]|uniref:TIR domain-containing protein n=1 Tax=Sinanodonta woodiana TaxID=1069815 RepID=A0ABD3U3Y0_SINWO